MRRPNPPGWTTIVGLGYDHQQQRINALALLRDGLDKCPRCRRPMYRRQRLDLDDFPSRAVARRLGVTPVKMLSHAKCNRSAGSKLGNALRKAGLTQRRSTPRSTTRRRW